MSSYLRKKSPFTNCIALQAYRKAMYLILSITCAILGVISGVKSYRFLRWLTIILAVSPSGLFFTNVNYFNGIYFLDYYFLGAGVTMLMARRAKYFNQYLGKSVLYVFPLLLTAIYLGVAKGEISELFLKDLRPLITLIEIGMVTNYVRLSKPFSNRDFSILVILSFFATVIYFTLITSKSLSAADHTYSELGYRYGGAGTYIAAAFLIYQATNPLRLKKIEFAALIMAVVIILISTSRTLTLAILIVAGLNLLRNSRGARSVCAVFAIGLGIGLSLASNVSGQAAERLSLEATSGNTFEDSQFYNRISPALIKINNFSGTDWVFGKGMGEGFEIPWFGYKGLDTENVVVDNYYISFLVKYGILGICLIFVLTKMMLPATGRTAIYYWIFCLICYLTIAMPYELFSIALFVFANIFSGRDHAKYY